MIGEVPCQHLQSIFTNLATLSQTQSFTKSEELSSQMSGCICYTPNIFLDHNFIPLYARESVAVNCISLSLAMATLHSLALSSSFSNSLHKPRSYSGTITLFSLFFSNIAFSIFLSNVSLRKKKSLNKKTRLTNGGGIAFFFCFCPLFFF